MKDTKNNAYPWLATVIALIAGYYSIRACLALPLFCEIFAEQGSRLEDDGIYSWILLYPGGTLWIVIGVLVITLFSIWCNFKRSAFCAALGILFLAIGAHIICSSSMRPLVKMMQNVDSPE